MIRKDIQALRAYAVGIVVIYHAGFSIFGHHLVRSGFIGVDIFFVISGYLIIGMMVSEYVKTGSLHLLNFVARRARRLIPAAALVLIFTLVASWLFIPGLEGQRAALDIRAASFYFANLRFAAIAMDYWAPQSVSPVIHFWSLGVEEQFYLMFPALMALLIILRRNLKLWTLVLVLAIISVGSYLLMQSHMSVGNQFGFYSPLSRAWEFALGGIVAILGRDFQPRKMQFVRIARLVAVLGLLYSAVAFSSKVLWPSPHTLIPVLSTMLLLWVGGSEVAAANQGPKLFELDFVQRIGTWSYSIYLWHWPLLFFATRLLQPGAKSPEDLKLIFAVPAVVLSVVFAAATYRWVENPLRNAPSLKASAKKSLAVGLGLSVLVAGLATVAYANPSSRLNSQPIADLSNAKSATINNPDWVNTIISAHTPKLTSTDGIVLTPGEIKSARSDFPRTYSNGCHTSSPDPALPKGCVFGSSKSGRLVGLFGNSHANQYFEGVLAAATESDAKVLSLTRSGCSVADVDFVLGTKSWEVCNAWRKNAVTAIIKARPTVLFVASTLKTSVIDPKTGAVAVTPARGKELYLAGFRRMVANFAKAGIKVVVIRDNPFFDSNALDCLSARTANACTQPLVPFLTPAQFSSGGVSGISNVVGVDLTRTYCTNKVCPAVRDGHIVWRDSHHLTSTYANLLTPIFSGIIKHEIVLN